MSQKQAQMKDTSQAQDVKLLQKQMKGIFKLFKHVVDYVKSGQVDQDELFDLNETAVTSLELFGSTCIYHGKRNEGNTLRAAYDFFNKEKTKLSKDPNDAKIIAYWLQYMECAIAAPNKLQEMKISKDTVMIAKNYLANENNCDKFFNSTFMPNVLASNHRTNDELAQVQHNYDQHHQQNQQAIQNSREAFNQSQQNAQCPSNYNMYSVYGPNVANKQMVSNPSDYFGKYAKAENENKDENKDNMEVENQNNQVNQQQTMNQNNSPTNGYVVTKPAQQLKRNNQPIQIPYPMPCQIIASLGQGRVGVQYAAPYRDIQASINMSNIETNTQKVNQYEQQYIIAQKLVQGLGYLSVKEIRLASKPQGNINDFQ